MSKTLGAALAAAALAFQVTPSAGTAPGVEATEAGKAVFVARCAECHDVGDDRAPSREELAIRTTAEIVATLTSGMMAPMAEGLSEAEKVAVAAYLTAARSAR